MPSRQHAADVPPESDPVAPDESAAPGTQNTVRLALNSWPVDAFDHGIDGVDPLTADGTNVPVDSEEAVRQAARTAGLSIRKVSE